MSQRARTSTVIMPSHGTEKTKDRRDDSKKEDNRREESRKEARKDGNEKTSNKENVLKRVNRK